MELNPDLKVLVVDDMLAMRTIIEKGLKDLGLTNVTHATDGLTAFKLIQKAIEEEEPPPPPRPHADPLSPQFEGVGR